MKSLISRGVFTSGFELGFRASSRQGGLLFLERRVDERRFRQAVKKGTRRNAREARALSGRRLRLHGVARPADEGAKDTRRGIRRKTWRESGLSVSLVCGKWGVLVIFVRVNGCSPLPGLAPSFPASLRCDPGAPGLPNGFDPVAVLLMLSLASMLSCRLGSEPARRQAEWKRVIIEEFVLLVVADEMNETTARLPRHRTEQSRDEGRRVA